MINYGKCIRCQLMSRVICYVLSHICFLEFPVFIFEAIMTVIVGQNSKIFANCYEVLEKKSMVIFLSTHSEI